MLNHLKHWTCCFESDSLINVIRAHFFNCDLYLINFFGLFKQYNKTFKKSEHISYDHNYESRIVYNLLEPCHHTSQYVIKLIYLLQYKYQRMCSHYLLLHVRSKNDQSLLLLLLAIYICLLSSIFIRFLPKRKENNLYSIFYFEVYNFFLIEVCIYLVYLR